MASTMFYIALSTCTTIGGPKKMLCITFLLAIEVAFFSPFMVIFDDTTPTHPVTPLPDIHFPIENLTRAHTSTQTLIDVVQEDQLDASCLNQIYDQIFVISSLSRMGTLSITLFQLDQENVNYTIWEGHSEYNPLSNQLWNHLRDNFDKYYDQNAGDDSLLKQKKARTLAYQNKKVFFLRQTQIDILKYSKKHKFSKILILEDDIIIANPEYINMFCAVEQYIPEWFILNIGINQVYPHHASIHLMGVEHSQIKYFRKNRNSYGCFGISFSYKIYDILIDLFDPYKSVSLHPLDNYNIILGKKTNKTARDKLIMQKCFNIHPNLILPDVTDSSLRPDRTEMSYIHNHTRDRNGSHFSKYWTLRFAESVTGNGSKFEWNITQIQAKYSANFGSLFRNAPSNDYLITYTNQDNFINNSAREQTAAAAVGIDSSQFQFQANFNLFEWIKSSKIRANISLYVNQIKSSQNNKGVTCENFAEIQHILWETPMLKLLLFIDRILTQNGFQYTFAAGTLLSVLRNGPILPWDKDADIVWLLNGTEILSSSSLNITNNIDFALNILLNMIAKAPEMNKYISCHKSNYVKKIKAFNCHMYGYPAYIDIFLAWNTSDKIIDYGIDHPEQNEIMSYDRFPPVYIDWDYYNLKNIPIERNWTIRPTQEYGSEYMRPDIDAGNVCYEQCELIKTFIPTKLTARKHWKDLLYVNEEFGEYDCERIKNMTM